MRLLDALDGPERRSGALREGLNLGDWGRGSIQALPPAIPDPGELKVIFSSR